MNIKELLLGTQEERAAQKTVMDFSGFTHLSSKNQRSLDNARQLRKRLRTRRTILSLGGAGVAAIAVTTLGLSSKNADQFYYDGPIADLKGKPLIHQDRFDKMIGEIVSVGEPFFDKIAYDLSVIHTVANNPPEFPSWVNEKSTPLPITFNMTNQSFFARYKEEDQSKEGKIFVEYDGEVDTFQKLKSYYMGINVGSSINVTVAYPLADSIMLAKEHLTAMLDLRLMSEFWDLLQKEGKVKITNFKGEEITERNEQLIVGASLGLRQSGMLSTNAWKVLDLLPVIWLAPSIDRLRKAKRLNFKPIEAFYIAADYLNRDPMLKAEIERFINPWSYSASILPPASSTERAFSDPIFSLIDNLYNTVYPQGPIIRSN